MILVEIRPKGGEKTTVAVHPKVTVLQGLDEADRRAWAADLAEALRGGAAGSVDVEVEVAGRRQVLTPAVAAQLGLDASCPVTVLPADLPGAKPAAPAPPALATDHTEHAVATVDELRRRLAEAEAARSAAEEEVARVKDSVVDDVVATLPALEAALVAARTERADAERALADVETRIARAQEQEQAERDERRAAAERLQQERTVLEANRTELVGRMIETGDPGDPKPVEEALNGLRRLRSVKPKPSARALELADEWKEATAQLAALPQPPQPPEWLVAPALEALQEARDGYAVAQRGSEQVEIAPEKIAALDRAHREVLEAEQRTMKKGSRSNRKKLDAAHEMERTALAALGVSSYGEYLQHVAPNINGGGRREDRLADAKAALADAEAVWEELHGGLASPEWTAAKERQAAIRQEARELVGDDVDDERLEAALRAHLETVVDTGWAEQALITALRRAGVQDVDEDGDVEAEAERWLAESPPRREARAALEAELADLDERLAVLEDEVAAPPAEASPDDEADAGVPQHVEGAVSVTTLRDRLAAAESAEREAESALQSARFAVSAAETKQTVIAALEHTAAARRTDVEELRGRLAETEAAGDRSTPPGAAAAVGASANGAVDLSAVVGMEAEAYLLARVAALRGATGGPLPMVVDGDALSGLSERAARRVFRLLDRLADSMQLVVLGDDEEIATWAEGLGDRAAVRTVAR